MDDSDKPPDRWSPDEPAQFPPPEWGKERSPVVGRLVTVAVVVVCVAAVAGVVVWGLGLLRVDADDLSGADRQETVPESAPAPTPTSRGANEANVGDCVKVVKGGMDAELQILECGAPAAIYRVALELEMGERCPAGSYTEYSAMGLGGWSLCLALEARPGQCFTSDLTEGFAATDCAAADFRVETVLTGTADGTACPPPPPNVVFHPEPLVYPTPPLTICLAGIPA